MKHKVQTISFSCNGYTSELRRCQKSTMFTGTEEQINVAFVRAGWSHGNSRTAMNSNYHLCDSEHMHPMGLSGHFGETK